MLKGSEYEHTVGIETVGQREAMVGKVSCLYAFTSMEREIQAVHSASWL